MSTRPRRPRISDLAEAAGVSVATVDRVLNGRHPVREETARRVFEAATALGYHATGLIRQRLAAELPQVRLGFVLLRSGQAFYQAFEREILAAVATAPGVRGTAVVEFAASQTPQDVLAALEALTGRVQAVAMVAPDHPSVTAAVEALCEQGVPVFALLSDFAPGVRDGYVGIDNRKSGRTAAWMVARAAPGPGKVAVFIGSHRFHGQELRESGFRSYFREHAPAFTLMETLVNLETRQITHEATLSLLARHDDLVGLYVAGGGMEGAITALREQGMTGRVALVVPELTQESRAALAEGLVTMAVSTPLAALCRALVALMTERLLHGAAGAAGQTFLPFEIFLPESI